MVEIQVRKKISNTKENIEDNYTPAQRKSVKTINNNMSNHLTDSDFSGIK